MTTDLENQKIAYFTIEGWGEVSDIDYDIQAISFTTSSGDINVQFDQQTLFTSSQIGSQMHLSSSTGGFDIFGTLISSSNDGSFIKIRTDQDNIQSVYSGSDSGWARLEDYYKLSTGVPNYVTGQKAIQRWIPALTDFSPTVGTSMKPAGGVSKVDGLTFNHNAIYESGLAATRYKILGEIVSGTITKSFEPLNTTDTTFSVSGLVAPWMNSYNDGIRPTLSGTYQPTFFGSEAIRIDEASDEFHPIATIVTATRALLGTEKQPHPIGEMFIDGLPTPLGRTCKMFIAEEIDESLDDAEQTYTGLLEKTSFTNGNSEQTLTVSSNLMESWARNVLMRETPKAEWADNFGNTVNITQYNPDSNWKWIKAGKVCYRLVDNSKVLIDYNAEPLSGHMTYRYNVDVVLVSDSGILNAIPVETLTPEDFGKLTTLNREQGSRWTNNPLHQGRSELITYDDYARREITGNWTDWNTTYNYDRSGFWGVTRFNVMNDEPEIEPAHVFEGNNIFSYIGVPVLPGFAAGPPYPKTRVISCSPVEALLQIITTRNGDGKNTLTYNGTEFNFDVLPSELGLGLTQDEIDVDSFFEIGWRVITPNLQISNAAIAATDVSKMKKWIEENLLKPFFLGLTTDDTGRLKLVDVASSDYESSIPELSNDDIFTIDGSPLTLEYSYETGYLTDQVLYDVERFWMNPTISGHKDKIYVRAVNDGISNLYERITQSPLVIKPDVGIVFEGEQSEAALGYRAGSYIANYRSIIPKLKISVSRDFSAGVGDKILVNISNLPMNLGKFQREAQPAIGLIISKKQDILNWISVIEVILIDTNPVLSDVRRWSGSGEVESKSTNAEFTISSTGFVQTEWNPPFTNNIDSFKEGDSILLIDEFGTVLSVDSSGAIDEREIIDITGNTITINSAFTDSSLAPIDPVGHYIIHGRQNLQSETSKAQFMWMKEPLPYGWESA